MSEVNNIDLANGIDTPAYKKGVIILPNEYAVLYRPSKLSSLCELTLKIINPYTTKLVVELFGVNSKRLLNPQNATPGECDSLGVYEIAAGGDLTKSNFEISRLEFLVCRVNLAKTPFRIKGN